jgi:hypothetical protein
LGHSITFWNSTDHVHNIPLRGFLKIASDWSQLFRLSALGDDMDQLLKPNTAPHLVLGIPTGSSPDEAVRAFAMKTRKVKNSSDSPFTIEDLTAALAEVQQGSREDAVSLQYAVPCNGRVFEPTSSFYSNGTKHQPTEPADTLLAAVSNASDSQASARTILAASIFSLFDWRWEDAGRFARECLRLSQDEDERDEALNILAASHIMNGDPERAMQALQKAVEGKWNLALQTNLALVATSQEPGLASAQMSFLINGASGAAEKLRAARMAINLWRNSQSGELEDDELNPLAPALLESMYGILTTSDLGEEDFFDIALFLERVDSGSRALRVALDASPHRDTPSAAVVKARSEGFGEYLDSLVVSSSQDSAHLRPWIQDRVDEFVRELSSSLLEGESERTSITVAFSMLRNGLDCSNFGRIGMRFLLMNRLHTQLAENAQPSEDFFRWHAEATQQMNKLGLPDEQVELLGHLRDEAGNKLGALTHLALVDQYPHVERAANQIIQRTSGFLNRLTADKTAVGSVAGKIVTACRQAVADYDRAIPLVTNQEIRKQMVEVRGYFAQVIQRMDKYR